MSASVSERVDAVVRALPIAPEAADGARQFVEAVASISSELLPTPLRHPLSSLMGRGAEAVGEVLGFLDDADEAVRAAALDALGIIADKHGATEELIGALEKFAESDSTLLARVSTQALCRARHEPTLERHRKLLYSKSRTVQRAAAYAVGMGRYERALPDLVVHLRPDEPTLGDAIIWALGEIGEPEMLTTLHAVLADHFLTGHTLEAIGKIARAESFGPVLAMVVAGARDERLAAVWALGRIALFDREAIADSDVERAKPILVRVIESNPSRLARYYAIVAFSRLGGTLPHNKLAQAIGMSMAKKDMDPMSAFFTKR